jgi:DNA primase
MIPAGFIQELLSRVDIVELIGRHVTLKKSGANYMGLCPFHGEKSPSFSVSPAKQFYHCFGCGVSGDAIKFLVEHTGASFRDAVSDLAGTVGLNVPDERETPQQRDEAARRREKATTLGDVMNKAASSYRDKLRASPRAIDYLKSRGLSGEIAARFALGYAPDGWRHLSTVFPRYDDPLLAEAGLVIVQESDESEEEPPVAGLAQGGRAPSGDSDRRERGGSSDVKRYDRFRDRIMFPIRDLSGDCIAFGARVIGSGEPKYLNSPETPLFTKGRELYGVYEGRKAFRERGYVLVVEGYMDVVALAQLGLANAVATLGTACTDDHLRKLLRFTSQVVFAFDGDAAGRRAAGRALEAALPHAGDTRSFKFLFLPPEHDPDTYVREHGLAAFESLVAGSVPLSRQWLEAASEGCDVALAEGRARLLAQAKPLWTALPAGALRAQLLADLASLAQVDGQAIAELWRLGRGDAPASAAQARGRPQAPPPLRTSLARATVRNAADTAAELLMLRSDWWQSLSEAERETLHAVQGWQGELFRWVERLVNEHGPQPWAALRAGLAAAADEGVGPWVPKAVAMAQACDPAIEPREEDLHKAVEQLLRPVLFQLPRPLPGHAQSH